MPNNKHTKEFCEQLTETITTNLKTLVSVFPNNEKTIIDFLEKIVDSLDDLNEKVGLD